MRVCVCVSVCEYVCRRGPTSRRSGPALPGGRVRVCVEEGPHLVEAGRRGEAGVRVGVGVCGSVSKKDRYS